MLEIDIQPLRGILFVRLKGNLDRRNTAKLNSEVVKFLKRVGIKNIVFNINDLEYMDRYGEKALINSFKICQGNKGQTLICIDDNKKRLIKSDYLFSKVKIVNDELAAVNLINS